MVAALQNRTRQRRLLKIM